MVKIAELKADQLRYLLRERNLGVSGSRAELVQRLVDHENSEEVDLAHAVGNMSQQEEAFTAQAAAISQLQQQMTTLTNMMAQFVNNMPTANQQQQRQQREDEIDIDDFINRNPGDQAAISHRQASVMRLGASNQDKLFTRLIHINEKGYNAFIDTGSQASIIRKSIADEIGADRQECFMKIVGICGGSRILTEALVLDIKIAGKIVTAKFYIAEDNMLQEDLLLGQDVITCAELLWKFEPTEIELKRAVHQPKEAERIKVCSLLEKFANVFSTGLEGIGKTNVVQAKIDVEGGQVVSQAPYRVSEPKKEVVAKMVDELLERDIITPSTSEYASPVVLIKKPNGSDRLCIDYRRLNKLIRKENFPVPNIEERLQEAKRFVYFSSLDLNSGYYQIEMEPESRKFTAFITTDGLFEFKRLPFGLKNAPAAFNRLMAELQKRVKKGDMIHYMDDILIGSQTFDEMYEKLERVLQVLRECGLTLNLGKYFEKPNNITEVRQFLGLTGYFRKFVPGYAIISEPLRILLRKDQKFKWEQPQDDAFEKLKISLTSKPVVTSYRIDAEHEVHTDASAIGLAGVLMQKDDDQLKPIAYYSRSTSKPEKNYHSYELEALAVVESLERFKYYIYGKMLLYGYEPRDVLKNTLTSVIQNQDQGMMTDAELEKLRADAANTINDHRAVAKKRYDAAHSKPTVYSPGDIILVENEPFSTGTSRKLEPRYKGPFIVSKVLPNDRYLVEDLPHAQRKQRHYKSVYSSDKMKRWCEIPPDEPDEDDEEEDDTN
ncbi:uncharacterized protein LOC122319558 [Drosophila yakuba]|uniref:uncharacterized protein LOC122319558 n=1 Tax=Drosophila yakuba TaxID=7245 RepID=UPI001C8B0517|nr:uncharacterized protein LOC122319558 [Drosophila yakuba]